jgi:phosphatidylglycerophosphatase A
MKPTLRWMLASPWRVLAFGFGSGLMKPMPGTWGTLVGWGLFVAASGLSYAALWLMCFAGFALGMMACARAGRSLGVADHGGIVWDEIVAVWVVLLMLPGSFSMQLTGVVLFRVFDIVKPPPIRYFDRRLKNGFGVMFDDLLAAFYTLLTISLWVRFFG